MGQSRLILGGQILFVGMLMLCFMLYLDLFRKDYYQRKGSLSLLFTLIVFLQYSHGFHGHTQYIQCVYHPLCDVADHYSCVPRFKDRFPDTRHHDINMLHIPTLPA